ncbi:hypothetical protein EMIHUDRAFT_456868, partial [Emiliania huxleyi CCMP1516]|uniref:Uncharacterized protein n=2 Tax=Emiliania huxleyi TaxID=2903 RepID=A0A0D3JZK9_EMIH1
MARPLLTHNLVALLVGIATAALLLGLALVQQQPVETRQAAAPQALAASPAAADVPILRLWRRPCPGGRAGFACDVQWDLQDRFLPEGSRWLSEWRSVRGAATQCQRGFFTALAARMTAERGLARMTAEHWLAEWDEQPFRIAATPPRTIGKMVHQLAMVNYFHLTLPPRAKPRLRQPRV